ncbi:MAG: phosphoribosyltransferase [Ectothiorhodospiraceae bacterium]|nr:phosphoribosyltransferase [Ectothiorhodospiraceae bacterium]
MFRDRFDAALQLGERLREFRGHNPLVLAIPRGGVPMGRVLADLLQGELDVVLVKKIPAPGQPECAIGAVDEAGRCHVTPAAERHFGKAYVETAAEAQRALLAERRERYSQVCSNVDPRGRSVIIVDDGSATGSTMEAALAVTRLRRPGLLVAALGVASPAVIRRLESTADRVVCVEISDDFFAVGQFFERFPQVSDEEVLALLVPSGQTE